LTFPSRSRSALLTALVLAAIVAAEASSPKFFQAATQTDFLKGDVQNLSIGSCCSVPRLSWSTKRPRRSFGR
jgi:hypothetical protein